MLQDRGKQNLAREQKNQTLGTRLEGRLPTEAV